MSTENKQLLAQTVGVGTSLLAAGGILSISSIINPLLDTTARSTSASQPSPSVTLPAIRFVFSRGSHVFPEAATIATAAFAYLYRYSPNASIHTLRSVANLLGLDVSQRTGYLVATLLSASIMPFTSLGMLPAANQRLRELADLEAKGRGGEIDREELKMLVTRFGTLNYVRGF
ncbi:hypothetical protein H2203_001009 [Taxawa tesnikishii (nom. ined.)]|nr:hypothetical protein H2203_001009 [Dothideales sp. JES 119]